MKVDKNVSEAKEEMKFLLEEKHERDEDRKKAYSNTRLKLVKTKNERI